MLKRVVRTALAAIIAVPIVVANASGARASTPLTATFALPVIGQSVDATVVFTNDWSDSPLLMVAHAPVVQTPASPFTLVEDDCAGRSVPAGETCELHYRFTRSTTQQTFLAEDSISYRDGGSLHWQQISLEAGGSLDFGVVALGATSSATFVLFDMTSESIDLPVYAAMFGAPSLVPCTFDQSDLASGAACTYTVTVRPMTSQDVGAQSYGYHVYTRLFSWAIAVAVSTPLPFALTSNEAVFQTAAGSQTRSFQITNTGLIPFWADIRLAWIIDVQGTDLVSFTDRSHCDEILAPGEQCAIDVTATNRGVGSWTRTMKMTGVETMLSGAPFDGTIVLTSPEPFPLPGPGPIPTAPPVIVGPGPTSGSTLDHFPRTVGLNTQQKPERFFVSAGQVFHSYLPNGQWTAPSSLGAPRGGVAGGEVGYDLNYLNNPELYVTSTAGQVWHDYATPGRGSGWNGWDPMGSPAAGISGEVVVSRNYVNNQELYVLGKDGRIYHSFATPGIGSGWSAWSSLGAPAPGVASTADVHVARNSLNNQELYVAAADGQIWHTYSTPGEGSGWSLWSPLGSPPNAVSDLAIWQNWANNQEMFRVGGGVLWHDYATPGVGSGWSGWYPVTPQPAVQLSGWLGLDDSKVSGTLTIWVTDTTGHYWSASLTSNTWSTWQTGQPFPCPFCVN